MHLLAVYTVLALLLAARRGAARVARNWAGNVEFHGGDTRYPATAEELVRAVRGGGAVHAVGSRHSFSAVADTTGQSGRLVSTARMNRLLKVDDENRVTVEPGITFAELGAALAERGLALSNYASLPHITLAGAVMTSTHGSGIGNGILATQVSEYDMVDASGRVHTYTLSGEGADGTGDFYSGLVSLGAAGIVARMVLQAVPQFKVKQCPFPNVPASILLDDVESFFKLGYSVSAFTDWKSKDTLTGVWIKSLAKDDDELTSSVFAAADACGTFHGRTATPLHPLPGLDPKGCTPMGVVRSDQGLPHFLSSEPPSRGGAELQSEYFVDMKHAKKAIEALFQIADQLEEHILVSEFRVVRADAFPLSLCYNREHGQGGPPCVGLHFTWKDDVEAVTERMAPLVEKTLARWKPRPHHGKIHTISVEEWRQRYPGWRRVAAMAQRNDPAGKFTNAFLTEYLGLGGGNPPNLPSSCQDNGDVDGESGSCADSGKEDAKPAPAKSHILSPYVVIVWDLVARHRMAVAFSVVALAIVAPFVMLKFVMDLAL